MTNQPIDIISPKPSLSTLFHGELNRLYYSRENKTPLNKTETESADLAELQSHASHIPAENLQFEPLISEDLPRDFTLEKITGKTITLAFLPILLTADSLNTLNPTELSDYYNSQSFYKVLIVDPAANNLTEGFGNTPGFFHDLLPEQLRTNIQNGGTSFTVNQTFKDREAAKTWYVIQMNQARKNLLKLLHP